MLQNIFSFDFYLSYDYSNEKPFQIEEIQTSTLSESKLGSKEVNTLIKDQQTLVKFIKYIIDLNFQKEI